MLTGQRYPRLMLTLSAVNADRASTYAVVLLLLAGMCICSIVVPSRFIGQMVFFFYTKFTTQLEQFCGNFVW